MIHHLRTACAALWVVAGVAIVAATGNAGAQSPQQAIETILAEEQARSGAPAMAAVAIADGAIVARATAGDADAATAFPAGSVTKVLTSLIVMQQVEAGRLDLDAPANTYLPERFHLIDEDGAPVAATLRQMLSHSSGMPVAWDGFPPNPPIADADAYLARNHTVVRPPGEAVIYSNSAMAAAGRIAAQAAGSDFATLAGETVFAPLAMASASLAAPDAYPGTLAAGHRRGNDGAVAASEHLDMSAFAPAGALIATAGDMARFALMLLDGGTLDGARVIDPASVAEMMRMQVPFHPAIDEGFGLGFAVRDTPGRRKVWWDGTTTGAAAHFALLPDHGAAVVVMASVADNDPTSVAGRRILDALVPAEPVPAHVPAPGALEALAGEYGTIDMVDPRLWFLGTVAPLVVRVADDGLTAHSMLVGDLRLRPTAPGRFVIEGSMLDGQTALFEGDRFHAGFVRAERLPWWATRLALGLYAGAVVLTVLAGLVWIVRRIWRALRRRRAA